LTPSEEAAVLHVRLSLASSQADTPDDGIARNDLDSSFIGLVAALRSAGLVPERGEATASWVRGE
jgi:hypothetical protein